MTSMRLSSEQVTQLVDLLSALATAPGTSHADRHQLDDCRAELDQQMPAIKVLVLAGVLHDATDEPALGEALRADCRRWSVVLAQLLRVASATTAPASNHPSPRSRRQQAPRLAA
jgi:hypothetical protein